MNKFIPYEKLSKKEKRKLDAERRVTWDINPITRKSKDKKVYDRKKKTDRHCYDDAYPFSFFYGGIF